MPVFAVLVAPSDTICLFTSLMQGLIVLLSLVTKCKRILLLTRERFLPATVMVNLAFNVMSPAYTEQMTTIPKTNANDTLVHFKCAFRPD
jgi:hypothetical protein